MESFIVRIYRRDKENPAELTGIVEKVGDGGNRVFHTSAELAEIIGQGLHDGSSQRKNDRLKLNHQLTVTGKNSSGDNFAEKTSVENLSLSGAYIRLHNNVRDGQELMLAFNQDDSNSEAIVSVARLDRNGVQKGVGVIFR
jgi:hypothetical protein